MLGLYADNFRGFTKQAISFEQVNFLVGENSTGKSSILSLLELLANPAFWVGGDDFSTMNVKLGSFSDLVSAHSANQKSFMVGFFVMSDNHDVLKVGNFRAVTFERGSNGLPYPKNLSFIYDNKLVCTSISNSSLYYKVLCEEVKPEGLTELFFECAEQHESKSVKGYKRIPTKGMPRAMVFTMALKLVGLALEGKKPELQPGQYDFEAQLPNTRWVAPIRAKPERTYDGFRVKHSASGEHIPRYLNNLIARSTKSQGARKLIDSIEKFGTESGLFKKIDTTRFGKDPTDPFQMQVKLGEHEFRINNVGYGVSQVLPVITQILNSNGYVSLIQQPEVHLHPKAQAALGSLIYETSKLNTSSSLIIETHSDYLINRFRLSKHKDESSDKVSAQVLFFERDENGNHIHALNIDNDGSYPDNQPTSFLDFFINEELDLMRL